MHSALVAASPVSQRQSGPGTCVYLFQRKGVWIFHLFGDAGASPEMRCEARLAVLSGSPPTLPCGFRVAAPATRP